MKISALRGKSGRCDGYSILSATVGAILIFSAGIWCCADDQPANQSAASSTASQPSADQAGRIYKVGKGYSLTFKSKHEVSELDAKTEKVRGTICEAVEVIFDVAPEAVDAGGLRISIQPQRLVLTSGKGANAVSLDTDNSAGLDEYQEGQTLKAIKSIRLTVEIAKDGGLKVISGSRPYIERLYPQAKGTPMAESVVSQIDGWLTQCLLQPVIYLSGKQPPDGTIWKIQRKLISSPIGGGEPFTMIEDADCKAASIKDDVGRAAVVEVSATCKPKEDTQGIEYTIKRTGRVEIDSDSGKMRFHRIATSYEGVVPIKDSPGKLRGSIVVEAMVDESAQALERISKPALLPATAPAQTQTDPTTTENQPSSQTQLNEAAGEKIKFDVKFSDSDRFILATSTSYSVRGKEPSSGELSFEVGCDTRADMPVAVSAGNGGTDLTIGVKRAVLAGRMKSDGAERLGSLDTADPKTAEDPVNKAFMELLNAVCKVSLDKSGAVTTIQDAGKFALILGVASPAPSSAPASGSASEPATQASQPANLDPAEWIKQVVGKMTAYLPDRPVAVGQTWPIRRKFMVVVFPTGGMFCFIEENLQAKLDSTKECADGRVAIIKLAGKAKVISPSGKVAFENLAVSVEVKFNLDAGRLVSAMTEITGNADMREGPDAPVMSKNTIRIVCQTAVKRDKSASQPAENGEK